MSQHPNTTKCDVGIQVAIVVFDPDDFHPEELREPLDAALDSLKDQLGAAINQHFGFTADDPFVAVDSVRGSWIMVPDL